MKIKIIKSQMEKEEIINECSNKNFHLACYYDENPNDYIENVKNIIKTSENKYILTPPYQYEQLEKWLYPGNWQIIYPNKSEYNFIDTYKASEQEIQKHLKDNSIELLIDSFHDNIEWNIIKTDNNALERT